jgi:GcrA cell cycle regulator
MIETTWTLERIALLKDRLCAGFSCGQIARELGVSRNAVIGKTNRLGLSRFKRTISGQVKQTGTRKNTSPRTASPRPVTQRAILRSLWAMSRLASAAEVLAETAKACSVLELQQWHCRWPIGDPTSEDFGFCGNRPVASLPYCAAHARIAYRPSTRGAVAHEHLAQAG